MIKTGDVIFGFGVDHVSGFSKITLKQPGLFPQEPDERPELTLFNQ